MAKIKGGERITPTGATQIKTINYTISLSRHEKVCLTRLRFERYFSHH